MSSKKEEQVKEIPETLIDTQSHKTYLRGKFLGKGGFAKCYELVESKSGQTFAGKIVRKSLLVKPHQKEKMSQEISIHRSISHNNIVGFFGFFEDPDNVYIVLELCRRRSLMELHKRRRAITEPETRYFMNHILMGVKYLHDNKIIHRDLKLGNLFLNEEMEVKIGDFGLATRVGFEGERKKTLCGTPNYIAPEILCKKGHSYEVDVWSIGCILYTLLVGNPPFETQTLRDTYVRIKNNEYHIPSKIGPVARELIKSLLQGDPKHRPNVQTVIKSDFMNCGFMPKRLPTSCLTMAPRFDSKVNASVVARKPLLELNKKESGSPRKVLGGRTDSEEPDNLQGIQSLKPPPSPTSKRVDEIDDANIRSLLQQVSDVVSSKPELKDNPNEDEAEDPAAVPMVWVSKWVDYSDKYGLGYQLCDDSIGVLFNDYTRLLLLPNGENIHYIERDGTEHYHTLTNFPQTLYKKVTLLRYFRNYMNEHLLKAAASMAPRDGDELVRIPSLKTYFRTKSAIVLYLTNGTLQINFFDDHTKLILCPLMGAVTYIDAKQVFRTFRLSGLAQNGCNAALAHRLRYAKTMIQKIISAQESAALKASSKTSSAASGRSQPVA